MDDLAAALPVVIDADCSKHCAESVNVAPLDLQKVYQHGSDDYRLIDYFLPVLVPFFVFFFTFILSAITFQRERAGGTLERLLIAPCSVGQILLGYVGGFMFFAAIQSTIVIAYFLQLIEFPITSMQIVGTAVVALAMLLVALMLGLLISFVANNEFQALQFIPLIVLPQLFLSDIFWDIDRFPLFFRSISYVLPLTHANIAMREIMLRNGSLIDAGPSLGWLALFFVLALGAVMRLARNPSRTV